MMNARAIAERWLSTVLAPTGVGVYLHPAPSTNNVYPLITYSPITGVAGGPLNNLHQVQNVRYQINVWDKSTSPVTAHRVGAKIMDLLTKADPTDVTWTDSGETYTGRINGCQYRGIVPIPNEVIEGVMYQRNGMEFEIQVLIHA